MTLKNWSTVSLRTLNLSPFSATLMATAFVMSPKESALEMALVVVLTMMMMTTVPSVTTVSEIILNSPLESKVNTQLNHQIFLSTDNDGDKDGPCNGVSDESRHLTLE